MDAYARRTPRDADRATPARSPPGCATPARSSSGPWSPVSLGDYAAGQTHVLPTAGAPCHSSGLTVRSFLQGRARDRLRPEALLRRWPTSSRRSPPPRTCPAHGAAVTDPTPASQQRGVRPARRPDQPLADLPLRPELVGEEPYGAPQLDVPVRAQRQREPVPAARRLGGRRDGGDPCRRGPVNRYPDREAARAARRAGGLPRPRTGRSTDIWAANGSNEVMTHAAAAFGGPGRTGAELHAHLLDVSRVRPQHRTATT